jgi:V/A-type H+-transporting ATPase subunit E
LALEIAALESRENSLATLESQKMLFQAKREALDAAYKEAYVKIRKMPKREREQLIRKLLERAREEIDVHTVHANDSDRAWVIAAEIKPLEEGGVICETKDGRVRVDYTFPTLFGEVKEKTIKEASKILFG